MSCSKSMFVTTKWNEQLTLIPSPCSSCKSYPEGNWIIGPIRRVCIVQILQHIFIRAIRKNGKSKINAFTQITCSEPSGGGGRHYVAGTINENGIT